VILTDAAVKNRATVGVLVVLIVLIGTWSYMKLPREGPPDVAIPIILVTTSYKGVSPEDVETSVTMKIEQELGGLKGLKEIRSTSAEGMSTVVIEFFPNIVIEDALQYVRDRVDLAKGELPPDAEEPTISEINIAEFPILLISVSGPLSPVRLKAVAEELEDAIERVPGVLDVDVLGGLEREIRLEVDPDRVAAYNLNLAEILRLVPAENVNISAGGLETEGTKFNVRVPAEFTDPGDVDRLVLAVRDGKPIYLRDVATVVDTFEDRRSYSRLDGFDSITLTVQKRVGADIIPVTDAVEHILASARRQVPEGVRLDITMSQAKHVRLMVKDLENNIFSGLVLVLVVLFVFLGLRTSSIVALAIPLSMLISFALIQALGHTLNMIVLFSLVLSLGMLVDNAIVIIENIYRHMQMGYSRTEAAIKGTREVAWPVATSTATTVAAFLPLLFWRDVMGDFMKYLPITVIVTLSSSLFVTLVISPTVCSIFATGARRKDGAESRFVNGYRGLLETALRHQALTLWLALLSLVAVGALFARFNHGVQFFPETDPDNTNINIRCPQGTNIRETDRLARLVEERAERFRADLDHVVTNVGSGAGNIFGGGGAGPHLAHLRLVFRDYEVRERPAARAVVEIREAMTGITGAEVTVEKESHGPPTGAAVNVRIAGEDFKRLEALGEEVKRLIADVPGLVNLRSDLELARPELVFRVDRRRAMLLGVDTATVGNFLKTAIFGRKVGTYRQFNDEYDITVRLPIEKRVDVEDIFSLQMPNTYGRSVPLSSLGTFDYRGGFGTINRIDQKRVVTISGDAEGRLGPAVLADAQKRLEGFTRSLPPGCTITYAGENEEMQKAEAFLKKAFVVALLLIVMILVTQFNSFQVPLIIMTTVGLSLVGVLTGLLLFRMPFGVIMTGIGVIGLAGVVVNNAIVLLDYTRRLQRRGLALVEAAVQAGRTRLRPVLLTATTTILSLIPMATGVSFDIHRFEFATRSQMSEFWRHMAIAVIFGLALATVLTLVVVPTLYVALHRLARRVGLEANESEKPAESATA